MSTALLVQEFHDRSKELMEEAGIVIRSRPNLHEANLVEAKQSWRRMGAVPRDFGDSVARLVVMAF